MTEKGEVTLRGLFENTDRDPTKTIDVLVTGVVGKTKEDKGSHTGVIVPGRGQSSYLELSIDGHDTVTTLLFDGSWPIYAGHRIRAEIDMALPEGGLHLGPRIERTTPTYRADLREREHPKTIELLTAEGKLLARYEN